MKRIIILGGSGFIGSSLLDALKSQKYKIKVLVYRNDISIDAEKITGNILTPHILDNQIRSGDIIINLIGQFSGYDPKFIDLNIKGGLNVLNSCIKKKGVRIILISSINVYGENTKIPSKESDPLRPISSYGIVKLITEKIYQYYSEVYGLNVTILRLSNVYGPNKRSGPVSDLVASLYNKKYFSAYNKGNQLRDFLFIQDAARGIIQAITRPQKGFTVFNISTGKRNSINDIIRIIEKITQKKLLIRLNSEVPDEECVWADYSKAKKMLRFTPKTNLEEGLKITVRQFKKRNSRISKSH